MRVLVLGGTKFVGRAITEAALGRGDAVALFNRGKAGPGLYPGIETVVGDRATDLARLEGREWDAVIDVAGYDPEVVRISAEAFAKTASRYVFVTQFIDARDLAAWIADACHHARSGIFNLTGDPGPFGQFLHDCKAATYSDAELTWIPSSRLLAAGVNPWMGIPMWIGDPALPGINNVDNSRATATGLALRPATETIHDTLAWDLARGGPAEEGLPPAEEARLLRELAG